MSSDSSLSSIPSLIPIPASQSTSNAASRAPTPLALDGRQLREIEAEAVIDKFATLFAPATPHASPNLTAISVSASDSLERRPSYDPPLSSADSEFGAFVSVPPAEDPLSLLSSNFSPVSPFPDDPTARSNEPQFTAPAQRTRPGHQRNISYNFFDKFAQDAKVASEKNKRDVLDELLQHEDDPLYWLNSQEGKTENETGKDNVITAKSGIAPVTVNSDEPLLDLSYDESYFSPPRQNPSSNHSRHASNSPTITHSRLVRSPSISATALAPPVASTSSAYAASPQPTSPQPIPGPLTKDADPLRSSHSPRQGSYSTLSNISSRWMSSLLSSRPSISSLGTAPALQDLFQTGAMSSGPQSRNSLPSSLPSRNSPSGSAYSTSAIQHAPHHAATSSTELISHGTPFAPHTSSVSPFAAHVYVPPSGAPGFRGEGYDWDKGFSTDLERELGLNDATTAGEGMAREMDSVVGTLGVPGNGAVSGAAKVKSGSRIGSAVDVGGLMERKSGSVELKGRRALTAEVLTVALADLIRPHLPALSRLPRTWHLLYSLDQDGISLKTLYARCENPPKPPTQARSTFGGDAVKSGNLIVVRDANDGLFGAWMGEGVHMSRGKGYYGSGESFLWRYARGALDIYKWTGRNDYVALCEPDFISFGGGDGNYGLYLDDTLYDGSSARCPTFDNEPLCSPGPRKGGNTAFECVGLEVWSVGP